ncbi:MAG: biotin transporter BioY [Bacteroidetes bacterium]|nr:biotin transporter BioY [Bacteroidota bacterium]
MNSVTRNKLIATVIGVSLMCIGANVTIDIGNNTVPFILSDFFALTLPLIVGWPFGFIGVLVYLILGAVGLPVYADGSAGIEHLYGPSAGYLIGYLVAAFTSKLIMQISDEWYLPLIAMIVAYVVVFTLGVGWLWQSTDLDLLHAYRTGLRPFWVTATLKIFTGWMLTAIIAPRLDPPILR